MKSVQKVTRIKLKVSHKNDMILMGLVSSEPDYKLSLSLNKKFRISLKNTSPIKTFEGTESELSFSRFSDATGSPDIIFNLLSNRSGKNFLLKNLKNVDFIFQIHDSENEVNINQITEKLKEIESVNAVFSIDINTFKDKNLHYLTP
jgi:hypothetical protein